MKKIFVTFCMAGALTALSSCGSTKKVATIASINGEWNIIEINGTVVVPAPGQEFPYIGFDGESGRIYGNSGCNRMMGTFDVNARPGVLDLGTIGTTRMMCPDMAVEQNVLTVLSQVKKYQVMGNENIALCGSSNRPIIVLQRKSSDVRLSDLAGKWMICNVGGVSVPDGMEEKPFIEFDLAEMKLHGNAGCNLINGDMRVERENPSAVSFPQVICTMRACPDMEIESRVLKALDAVRSFGKLADGGVGLYDADGSLVMSLVK